MKKIFTSILFLLPFLTFAQGPWNFDTSTQGFTANSSAGASGPHTVTQTAGDLKVNFVASAGNNPIIRKADAGIDADNNINFIEIRLKNFSTVSYLRLCPTSTTNNYGSVQISTDNSIYQTIVIDVTAWTGAAVGIDILCKKYDGSSSGLAYTPVAGEYILIDYIKPLAYPVTPEVNVFNFDTTNDNFTTLTRATAVQATESTKGTLKINCTTAASSNAKVSLSSIVAHVEGTNKYAHITLKNTSTNTLFQLNGKVGVVGIAFNPIQTYTTSDAAYKTYDFDLTTWNNGYQFPELNFGVKDTWLASPQTYASGATVISGNSTYKNLTGINTANAPKADIAATTLATTPPNWELVGSEGVLLDLTNFIYIDKITFDNVSPVLSIGDIFSPIAGKKKKVTTISLYPNPTKETLNIEAKFAVNKIEIYNLSGQNVLQNQNSNKIDVINLDKGVYFVKVTQKYGDPEFLKFIKD